MGGEGRDPTATEDDTPVAAGGNAPELTSNGQSGGVGAAAPPTPAVQDGARADWTAAQMQPQDAAPNADAESGSQDLHRVELAATQRRHPSTGRN